jgi:hypothetical protein
VASVKVAIFFIVVPCSLAKVDQHFRGETGELLPGYIVQKPRR